MRVNIYAEEMTDRIEIIEKELEGGTYTAVRFYLELPCTVKACCCESNGVKHEGACPTVNLRGPFMHHAGDDDSAAVTFWGKKDLRAALAKALELLDAHHAAKSGARRHELGAV